MTVVGNFAQVQAALLALIPRVALADEAVEEAGARLVAQAAEGLAPRLTGKLAASVGPSGGEVRATVPYAAYQEYGTRRHKAQPFLRPARDASEVAVRGAAEQIYMVATR